MFGYILHCDWLFFALFSLFFIPIYVHVQRGRKVLLLYAVWPTSKKGEIVVTISKKLKLLFFYNVHIQRMA